MGRKVPSDPIHAMILQFYTERHYFGKHHDLNPRADCISHTAWAQHCSFHLIKKNIDPFHTAIVLSAWVLFSFCRHRMSLPARMATCSMHPTNNRGPQCIAALTLGVEGSSPLYIPCSTCTEWSRYSLKSRMTCNTTQCLLTPLELFFKWRGSIHKSSQTRKLWNVD